MILGLSFKGDGLRSRSVRSAMLTGVGFGASNALRLGGNLILTRILFPEAFGIMALVQVFMTGLNMFSDLGIHASIIQNPRGKDPAFLDTAWVLQILRGIVLFILTWLLASPVSEFYDVPVLAQLLPVVGLTALFQGFNSTNLALARRNLEIGYVTTIELGANSVGLIAMIILALIWKSVWALVVGSLVAPFLIMIFSHMALPWYQNRLGFEKESCRSLIKFGKFIFLSTVATFVVMQADRAILGKFVSLSDLAFYNIAFMFASIPIMVMRKLNNAVFFPLYSRAPPAKNLENYRNIAKARWLVMGSLLAMLAVLAVFGNHLIIFLYDPRYEAAGALVVLIAVASMALVVTGGYEFAILASGDSRRYAAILLTSAFLLLGCLYVLILFYGMIGAVLSPLISTILFYPFLVWFLRPYKAWIPKQDMVFCAAACIVAAVALWVNYDALQVAMDVFGVGIPLIEG